MSAAHWNRLGIVKLLLKNRADPNLKRKYGWNALMYACMQGHLKTAQTLLAYDARLEARDDDGRTALHHAAGKGKTAILKILLNKGANVNAVAGNGWTPLMWAAEAGQKTAVKFLLRYHADVNIMKIIEAKENK